MVFCRACETLLQRKRNVPNINVQELSRCSRHSVVSPVHAIHGGKAAKIQFAVATFSAFPRDANGHKRIRFKINRNQWRHQRSKGARSFRGQNILEPGHPDALFFLKKVDDLFRVVTIKTQRPPGAPWCSAATDRNHYDVRLHVVQKISFFSSENPILKRRLFCQGPRRL